MSDTTSSWDDFPEDLDSHNAGTSAVDADGDVPIPGDPMNGDTGEVGTSEGDIEEHLLNGAEGGDEGEDGDEVGDGTQVPPVGTGDGTDGGEGDGDEGEPVNLSGVELYLAQFDIEGGMIGFDDGSAQHFNDLTPDKQAEVLQTLHATQASNVEKQYGLDETEIGLINYMRENNTNIETMVEQMVQQRLTTAQTLQQIEGTNYAEMEDDAVYMKMLQQSNPEATAEQLEAELETAKKLSGYTKQTEYFRNQFAAEQEATIAAKQQQDQFALQQQEEQDRAAIVNAVQPITEIAGVQLTDDIKNSVFDRVLETTPTGDSLFMADAFSADNPENAFKAAFWYYNGEELLKQRDAYWKKEKAAAFARGRATALGTGDSTKVSFNKTTRKVDNSAPINNEADHNDDSFFL